MAHKVAVLSCTFVFGDEQPRWLLTKTSMCSDTTTTGMSLVDIPLCEEQKPMDTSSHLSQGAELGLPSLPTSAAAASIPAPTCCLMPMPDSGCRGNKALKPLWITTRRKPSQAALLVCITHCPVHFYLSCKSQGQT